MKKQLFKILLILVLAIPQFTIVQGEAKIFPNDLKYTLIDYKSKGDFEILNDYVKSDDANKAFDEMSKSAHNLIMVHEGTIVRAEYAVVTFIAKERCTYNVEYKHSDNNENGYTNTCYAVDAAYIQSNDALSKVEFLLSGVKGWAKLEDVILDPIEKASALSKYQVKGNELFHFIKTTFENDDYDTAVNLGKAPTYLVENVDYFSYDGHYFYTDNDQVSAYQKLIDDMHIDTKNNAVNSLDPYYNYYLYLSHRTSTNYSYEELNNYFEEQLFMMYPITSFVDSNYDGVSDLLTRSQYVNQLSAFFQYQDEFGANALMMLALSMNETALGRSSLSFTRNNLFGHAAYDSAVEKNASRYSNIASSVLSHASNYINKSYLNPEKFQYHGGFFGNKASGFNVSYASDPYWGEKAAQYYYQIDQAMGNKDYNAYALGIKTTASKTKVYTQASTDSDVIYEINSLSDFAFTLLELVNTVQGDWYKIQTDPTLNVQGNVEVMNNYDYAHNVGYIPVETIDLLINKEKLNEKASIPITFEANGGIFNKDQSVLTLYVSAGQIPSVVAPFKEGNEFIGWDQELAPVSHSLTYVAQYKEVSSIEMVSLPRTTFDENERIDIQGGKILVKYVDGTSKEVELLTSMISGYDMKLVQDQQVSVSYGGSNTSYPLHIVGKDLTKLASMENEIDDIVEGKEFNQENKAQLFTLHQQILEDEVIVLNRSQRKAIDTQLQKVLGWHLSIIINPNEYKLSASGLTLALDLAKLKSGKFFPDILKIKIDSSQEKEKVSLLTDVAKANSYDFVSAFKLNLEYNGKDIQPLDTFIVSLELPDPNRIYTILYTDGKDVIRLSTSQSKNKIRFETAYTGTFAIVSRNTSSVSEQPDILENNRCDNNGLDYGLLGIGLIGTLIVIIGVLISVVCIKKNKALKSRKKKGN